MNLYVHGHDEDIFAYQNQDIIIGADVQIFSHSFIGKDMVESIVDKCLKGFVMVVIV